MSGLLEKSNLPKDFALESISATRMVDAGWVEPALVLELFAQKDRLDALYDSGKYPLYKRIAEALFPQDKRGAAAGTRNLNRAGDKLAEVLTAVPGLLPHGNGFLRFVDLGGAPGAFSDLLLRMRARGRVRGWGMSLRSEPQVDPDGHIVVAGMLPGEHKNHTLEWYRALVGRRDFEIHWGPTGTGSLYDFSNIESLANSVAKAGGAHIVVADGGFEVPPVEGVHMENFQELLCARLIFAECLCALKCLSPGGGFVCKLFDTVSSLSATTIYLMLAAFHEVRIVKPVRSRASNSERYLCCVGFRGDKAAAAVLETMTFMHADGFVGVPGVDPVARLRTLRAVFPIAAVRADARFRNTFRAATTRLVLRQIETLKAIIDATLAQTNSED